MPGASKSKQTSQDGAGETGRERERVWEGHIYIHIPTEPAFLCGSHLKSFSGSAAVKLKLGSPVKAKKRRPPCKEPLKKPKKRRNVMNLPKTTSPSRAVWAGHLSMVPRHEIVSSLTVFTCSHIHTFQQSLAFCAAFSQILRRVSSRETEARKPCEGKEEKATLQGTAEEAEEEKERYEFAENNLPRSSRISGDVNQKP